MNYDLDTEEGMANSVAWTQNLFSRIKDGGQWIVPRSGAIFEINNKTKVAKVLTDQRDTAIERVIEKMDWKIEKNKLNTPLLPVE